MAQVTAIGLGAMGSALARAFLEAGHELTVWNRTAARMDPLVSDGAVAAETASDAVRASPVTVLCIDNYDVTQRLFEDGDLVRDLVGRTLVQLSTGTPAEARALGGWLDGQGVGVLDGAIMPYPDGIGAPDAQILLAGKKATWDAAKPLLDCLGGDLRHVGEEIGAAAVLDMALLTHQLSSYLGVWHGALICEAEGLPTSVFAGMFDRGDPAADLAARIAGADYANPGATLGVWNASLDRILAQADATGINREIPGLISSLFRRAIALGYGAESIASVIEVLRTELLGRTS